VSLLLDRCRSLARRVVMGLIVAALVSSALADPALAATSPGGTVVDGHLSGTVRNAAGVAAANSVVTLLDGDGHEVAHTTADSTGHYGVNVPKGTYLERIVTKVAGQQFAARIADLDVGDSMTRDVIVVSPIVPTVTVTGTVRNRAGDPLPDVLVELSGADPEATGAATTTAPDGTYRLTAVPGTYTVLVQFEVDGLTYAFNGTGYKLHSDDTLDLVTDRPLSPVIVHDERGAPVAGARVTVHSPYNGCDCRAGFDLFPGAVTTTVSWMASAVTDGSGTVQLPLFAGEAVISVWPPDGRTDLAPMPETHYSGSRPSPLVVVEPSATTATNPGPTVTFQGHLRDSDGHVPDATISLSTGAGSADSASLDPAGDGSFSLTVPPGHYGLSIYGFETNHNPDGDSGGPDPDLWINITDLNLDADRVQDITIPTRTLPIQVLDRDGNPSPQSVEANSEASAAHPIALFPGGTATAHLVDSGGTAADGTTTLQVLSGSTVSLSAGWQYPLGTASVSGDASSATIHLTAVTLSGTLRDPRGVIGEPTWRTAWVSLDTNPCNPPISTELDVQHGYAIPRMPGDYTLCVSDTQPWDWADGGQVATDTLPLYWSITAPYQATKDQTLDLTVPDAQPVHITAVDERGLPLDGRLTVTATTTTSNLALAPGITGQGWVDNDELDSDHGAFEPLIFGRSHADLWVARHDEQLGHHFLATLTPGDNVTVAVATVFNAPSVPRNVRATAAGETRTITWDEPADTGGSPVTGYVLSYEMPGGLHATITVPGNQTQAALPSFGDPTYYRVWVAALNDAGAGPDAEASWASTDEATPAEPPTTPGADPTGTGQSTTPGPTSHGYWALGSDGHVYNFGDAAVLGNATAGAVDLEPTPTGKGYWTLNKTGQVQAFGDAAKLGDVDPDTLAKGETPASLSATPSGAGYWVFTNRGRAIAFGDAPFLGDMSRTKLNGPVLGSVATPSGKGYYMVASDGGIFAFGDATFTGSMGGQKLNAPVQSLVPDSDGRGYWLVATDGGVFAFDAPFRGSMGGKPLNKPVVLDLDRAGLALAVCDTRVRRGLGATA